MRTWLFIVGGFSLSGCSPSHEIAITSDEAISRAEIELENMKKSEVKLVNPKLASIEVWAGDSSGTIRVHMVSGKIATCQVSYVADGDFEPHIFAIERGRCNPVIQE